ncbi:hypothetical protein [Pseudomonas lurida]|uniref:hypothetical protein n=1 Tax=Pseudomonas lurida TaxID=244566 RepID=UPI0027341ADF|nr:hypothetical protein [Pseudomonas lurida]WLG31148.1 hypothetical protein PSH68_13425 [Pseudomonas lurida]
MAGHGFNVIGPTASRWFSHWRSPGCDSGLRPGIFIALNHVALIKFNLGSAGCGLMSQVRIRRNHHNDLFGR